MKKSIIPILFGGGTRMFTDSFIRANGAADGRWIGAGNLQIASNIAYIEPVTGDEILTDPDLEGTYTDGLCANLTKYGSPTVSQSATVHSGSKAQEFTATAKADRIRFAQPTPIDNTHYVAKMHGRRTSGAVGKVGFVLSQTGGYTIPLLYNVMDGNFKEYELTSRSEGTGIFTIYAAFDNQEVGFDTVIVDDFSFKPLTHQSLFKVIKSSISNVKATAKIFLPHFYLRGGIVICADNPTNVQNGLIAWIDRITLRIEKLVNGVFSTLSATTTGTYKDWGELSIVFDGTNVSVYYDNVLKGGPIAVTDLTIINNKYHGIYSSSPKVLYSGFGFAPSANTITLNERNSVAITNDSGNIYNAFGGCVKSGARIIGVYRKGTSHDADNGVIVQRISIDSGATWGSETTIASDGTYDCRDASITLLSTGNLILVYSRYNIAGSHVDIKCKISTDNGDTWGAAIDVTTGATAWSAGASPVIEDSTGRILLAYYCQDTGDTYASSRLVISSDGGATWGNDVVIANGETGAMNYYEPELLFLSGTTILCLIRGLGYAIGSISTDDGATWSAVTGNLFVSGSINHMEKMSSGRVVVICRYGEAGTRLYSSPDGINWYPDYYSVDGSDEMEYGTPIDLGSGLIGCFYSVETVADTTANMYWATIPESRLAQD